MQQPQMKEAIELRDWSQTLCECSPGDCMLSCCCSCLVGKEIAEALGDSGTTWCCLYCCCFYLLRDLLDDFEVNLDIR